jgi:large subunit ribosomal protein L13
MKKIRQSDIKEKWYLVDAKGLRLGNIASVVAQLLLAKDNPLIRDYLMPKNKVVVINAEKFDYTPKKGLTKFYKRYSGYQSGLKVETLDSLIMRRPTEPLRKAIKGMLPKNSRGRAILAQNLFIYAGGEHPHTAQKPVIVDIKKLKL